MLEKPYRIVGSVLHESCVMKLKYRGKYVIVKAKDSIKTLKMIEKGLNAFLRGGKNNPAGFHFHLYNYVKDHPGGHFRAEYLLDSDNGYELLKKEQEALDRGLGDPNMLNNQTQAYVPPYNEETGLYGWITPNANMNFNKWLKRRKAKKTAG